MVNNQPQVNEQVKYLMNRETELTFIDTVINPFRPKDEDMDRYEDDMGFEYWAVKSSGKLIQVSPRLGFNNGIKDIPEDKILTLSQLRSMARDKIEKLTPGFSDKGMYPYEENRRNKLFLFRWEGEATENEDIPPFIQVGLYADGSVACYTDAL